MFNKWCWDIWMVNQEEGNTWELVSHNNRNNSKLIKYLNFKTKAITELGKKKWKNIFYHLKVGKAFLQVNKNPEVTKENADKTQHCENKNAYMEKPSYIKSQMTNWEKTFPNILYSKV